MKRLALMTSLVLLAVAAASSCGAGSSSGDGSIVSGMAGGGAGVQKFAVSIQGDDVGYMELTIEEHGPDSLKVVQRIDWNMILMGTRRDIVMTMTAYCDTLYDLGSLSMEMSDGTAEISINAVRQDSLLMTTIGTSGRSIENTTILQEDYLPVLADLACASMEWEPGQVRTFQTFDPASGIVLQSTAACSTFEEIVLLGDTVTAALLELSQMGTRNSVWVFQGQIVKEVETGLGMVMTRVPPGQSGEVLATRDLYEVFSVSTTPITSPRSTGTRTYILEGEIDWTLFDLNLPPVQEASGCTLTVTTGIPGQIEPFPAVVPEELLQYTVPEAMIQCDDPTLAALADSITAGSSDSWEAARRISSWVDGAVENSPTVSLPSAVDVMDNLRGDCNEHTILMVALARAAGLPARVCAGIVYIDRAFGYHAWPMVWVGEWVEMDPTFGQYVADATHLVLATGSLESQYVINTAIGRLSVRELETP